MEIIAFRYIARTEAPHKGAVVELFLKTALEICEGQQYDMEQAFFWEQEEINILAFQ